MGVIGIGFVVGSIFLPNFLQKRYSKSTCILSMYGLCAIIMVIIICTKNQTWNWILIVPAVATNIAAYVTVTALYSQLVSKEGQGWIMGVSVSIACFGLAFSALMGGWLLDISARTPITAAIGFTLLGSIIGLALRSNLKPLKGF